MRHNDTGGKSIRREFCRAVLSTSGFLVMRLLIKYTDEEFKLTHENFDCSPWRMLTRTLMVRKCVDYLTNVILDLKASQFFLTTVVTP
jgi:hypothetical protein